MMFTNAFITGVGNPPPPNMSVHGDNTAPLLVRTVYSSSTRPYGVVGSLSPGGGGLKEYRPCSVGQAGSEEVIKQA